MCAAAHTERNEVLTWATTRINSTATRKEPDTEGHMPHDPVYMKTSRTGKSIEAHGRSVVAKAWEEGEWG